MKLRLGIVVTYQSSAAGEPKPLETSGRRELTEFHEFVYRSVADLGLTNGCLPAARISATSLSPISVQVFNGILLLH